MRERFASIFTAVLIVFAVSASAGLAASDDAGAERQINRVTDDDAKQDAQPKANPCKAITENSTRKQRKACEDFLKQQ